jgi:hypothetical protein
MWHKLLLTSIGGALAFGLLTASVHAAPAQFGTLEKSAQPNSLVTLTRGHGMGGGFGGAQFHGFHAGNFAAFHGDRFHGFNGGRFAAFHGVRFRGHHTFFHHHHHNRFVFFVGVPYYDYYGSDCWWSRRYHHWVCPSY